ncbi:hypothetical protein BH10ACI2_BH10ACI2_24690 [soil metagenome]
MIRTLQILAVALGGLAAYFMWIESKDGVFVSVVLSACALFMSIRFQAKARLDQHKTKQGPSDES